MQPKGSNIHVGSIRFSYAVFCFYLELPKIRYSVQNLLKEGIPIAPLPTSEPFWRESITPRPQKNQTNPLGPLSELIIHFQKKRVDNFWKLTVGTLLSFFNSLFPSPAKPSFSGLVNWLTLGQLLHHFIPSAKACLACLHCWLPLKFWTKGRHWNDQPLYDEKSQIHQSNGRDIWHNSQAERSNSYMSHHTNKFINHLEKLVIPQLKCRKKKTHVLSGVFFNKPKQPTSGEKKTAFANIGDKCFFVLCKYLWKQRTPVIKNVILGVDGRVGGSTTSPPEIITGTPTCHSKCPRTVQSKRIPLTPTVQPIFWCQNPVVKHLHVQIVHLLFIKHLCLCIASLNILDM